MKAKARIVFDDSDVFIDIESKDDIEIVRRILLKIENAIEGSCEEPPTP